MEWKASERVLPILSGPCDNSPHSAPLHCHGHGGFLLSMCLLYEPSVSMAADDPHWTQPLPPGERLDLDHTRFRSEGKASFTRAIWTARERERGQREEGPRAESL